MSGAAAAQRKPLASPRAEGEGVVLVLRIGVLRIGRGAEVQDLVAPVTVVPQSAICEHAPHAGPPVSGLGDSVNQAGRPCHGCSAARRV